MFLEGAILKNTVPTEAFPRVPGRRYSKNVLRESAAFPLTCDFFLMQLPNAIAKTNGNQTLAEVGVPIPTSSYYL